MAPRPKLDIDAMLNGWDKSDGKPGERFSVYLTAYDKFDYVIERHGFLSLDAALAFAAIHQAPFRSPIKAGG